MLLAWQSSSAISPRPKAVLHTGSVCVCAVRSCKWRQTVHLFLWWHNRPSERITLLQRKCFEEKDTDGSPVTSQPSNFNDAYFAPTSYGGVLPEARVLPYFYRNSLLEFEVNYFGLNVWTMKTNFCNLCRGICIRFSFLNEHTCVSVNVKLFKLRSQNTVGFLQTY